MRLFFVQIVQGKEYLELAENQYVVSSQQTFSRGSIFFSERNGHLVSAATLAGSFTVALHPKEIIAPEDVYEKLSPFISLSRDVFLLKARKPGDPYEEIAKRASKETAEKIEALGIQGVSILKERFRVYPGGRRAAHVLGLIGYQGDVLAGRYGIERYYNDILERPGEGLYVNFFAEIFSNIADSILKTEKAHEGDVVLFIEPTVQGMLEEELLRIQSKWSADNIGGVVMDPKDGRIIAMAGLPDFDPNNFRDEESPSVFSNSLVESVYEMGSTIKPLAMAAAIDAGAVTAKTTYEDKGYVYVNKARIENFDGKARGVVSMQEVLNQSLNTGMVFVMQKMGREKFSQYMKSYELGEETGIEVPGERHGIIDNLDSPRDIEHATAAFGQGIAMTPIETVRALSALGNGGVLVTPRLVDRIEYRIGGIKKTYPDNETRVLKKETSEEITRMLVEVVDQALLGGTVALPRYSIAAKTGTAQIADIANKTYYEDQYLHSFFGYFPAYEPKFIIFLYQVNPKKARYASETLTSPFMDITKFLINYYEIPPDR